MKAKLRRVGIITIGWLTILAGILLALPFVPGPGVLVILIGLYILSSEQHWARHLLDGLHRRFPKLATTMHQARERARNWVRRRKVNHQPVSE